MNQRVLAPWLVTWLLLATPLAAAGHEPHGVAAVAYPEPIERLARDYFQVIQADFERRLAAGEALPPALADTLEEARTYVASSPLRARPTFINVENYEVTARFHDVWRDVQNRSTEEAKKERVLETTLMYRHQALLELIAFRKDLKAFEDNVTSVSGFEYALYAADQAVVGRVTLASYDVSRNAFESEERVLQANAYPLVETALLPLLKLRLARDLLAEAQRHDGQGVRLNRTAFDALASGMWASWKPSTGNPAVQAHENLVSSAVEAREKIFLIAAFYQGMQASRTFHIRATYGELAGSTGQTGAQEKLREAATNALANANVTLLRHKGFEGVWSVDRIDFVDYVVRNEYGAFYWPSALASLRGVEAIAPVIAQLSTAPDPIPDDSHAATSASNPPDQTKPTPGPGAIVAAAAIAGAAMLATVRERPPRSRE